MRGDAEEERPVDDCFEGGLYEISPDDVAEEIALNEWMVRSSRSRCW